MKSIRFPGRLKGVRVSAILTILLSVLSLMLVAVGQAQQPVVINYQGYLTDSEGNPVNATQSIIFTVYDGLNVAQWTETHPSVAVTEGRFSILLGSINTLPDNVFTKEERYLGIKIGEDAELTPRTRLASAPTAALAHRVDGDILTEPGKLSINGGVIMLSADSTGATVSLADPNSSPSFPNITISGDATGGGVLLADPRPSPIFGSLELRSEISGASIALADPRPSPSVPDLLLLSDQEGSQLVFGELGNLKSITDEVLSIKADNNSSSISLNCNSPEKPSLSLNTDCNGSNIAFGFAGDFPAKPAIDMRVDELEANMDFYFGKDPTEYPHFQVTADTQEVCMSIGWGSNLYNIPAWSLCVEPWSWRATWNIADLFIIRSGPEANEFVVNNADGITRVTLTEQSLLMDDVSTNAKAVLQSSGLTVYDEGGSVAAVFEPNGIVAPKANFGSGNSNGGTNAFVVGQGNTAGGNYSSVLGGSGNAASGGSAVVAGGVGNEASFGSATVGGGQNNTASGLYSCVPGGNGNTASGAYSFAAGRGAQATHSGAMVLNAGSTASTSSDIANQFKLRATGGTIILSDTDATSGVRLSKGSSVWQSLSDRNSKRNIRPVDGETILKKLEQMPVSRWSYKTEDESIEHIGPMAQDFYELFELGEDDKHISSLDPSGVALAAIKQLHKENKKLIQLLAQLERRLTDLEGRE